MWGSVLVRVCVVRGRSVRLCRLRQRSSLDQMVREGGRERAGKEG